MIANISPVALLATQAVNNAVVLRHEKDTVASIVQTNCVVVTVSNYITVPADSSSTSKAKSASKITVLVTETGFSTTPPSTVPSLTKSRTFPETYLSYGPISSSSKSVPYNSSSFILVPKHSTSSISLHPEMSRVSVPVIRSSNSTIKAVSSIIPRNNSLLDGFIYAVLALPLYFPPLLPLLPTTCLPHHQSCFPYPML